MASVIVIGVAVSGGADSAHAKADRRRNFVLQIAPSSCCVADSAVHNWTVDPSVPDELKGPILDTLFNSYDTTDLDIPASATSHTATVDITFYEGYAGGRRGQAQCIYKIAGSANRCDHWHVTLDLSEIAIPGNPTPTQVLKAIECHEIGHTVGLTHPSEPNGDLALDYDPTYGCMMSKDPPLDDYLRVHNVAHINQFYPY